MGFLFSLKFQNFAAIHVESGASGLLNVFSLGEFSPVDDAQQRKATERNSCLYYVCIGHPPASGGDRRSLY